MHKRISDIKAEENDIAVVHDIFLALAADKTFFLCGGQRTAGDEIVEAYDLGAYESALKVGVNLSCRLGSLCAAGYCPGSDLGLAGGQI